MKEFIKDLPLYINGFAVGSLLFSNPEIGPYEISMFILAGVTLVWHGRNERSPQ